MTYILITLLETNYDGQLHFMLIYIFGLIIRI